MARWIVFWLLAIILTACGGQKETAKARTPNCETIVVDMEQGMIEGFSLKTEGGVFKAQFPCHSYDTTSSCGTKQVYAAHGFAFIPDGNVLILEENFLGRPSAPAISLGTREATKYYGEPAVTRTIHGKRVQIYTRSYGALVLVFNDRDKAEQVQLHSVPPEKVTPCF